MKEPRVLVGLAGDRAERDRAGREARGAVATSPIVAIVRAAISAATWRWQLRPWQSPMPARVNAFTTFDVG